MNQLFTVLTSFKFDVGGAVQNAERLQMATERLGASAQSAVTSFQALGFGIAASFGLGTGGALSMIQRSIIASEKLGDVQEDIANILGQNSDRFVEDISSFNSRLAISEKLMQSLAKTADEFALPQMEMFQLSQSILSTLLSAGLQGQNFKNVEAISKGAFLSGPMLGIRPQEIQNLLVQAMTGTVPFRGAFRSLAVSTKAFQGLGVQGKDIAKAFNVAPVEDRIEMLANALMQFGSDQEYLDKQVRSVRFQVQLLNNQLFGFNGILKVFGEVMAEFFIDVFIKINQTLARHKDQIVSTYKNIFETAMKQPRAFMTNLMQISTAGKMLDIGRGALQLYVLLEIMKEIPAVGKHINPAMLKIKDTFAKFFATFTTFGGMAAGLRSVTKLAGPAMAIIFKRILPIVGIITAAFTLISRALAMARVRDLVTIPENLIRLGQAFQQFSAALAPILSPLKTLFDGFAWLLSWVFSFNTLIKGLIFVLEALSAIFKPIITGVFILEAGLRGFFTMFLGFMEQLGKLMTFQGGFSFQKFIDDYNAGINDVFDRQRDYLFGTLQDLSKAPVATLTQNIDNVTINQDFKEAQDPDRIAFTVQEALLKIAQNPTQGAGRSFAGGLAR